MTLKQEITATEAPSFSIDIFIAGDYAASREACREFCLSGECVSITPADFVFTGGMESGVRIGLINYARFPRDPETLWARMDELARFLIERLHQQSCSIVGPDRTVFLSRRAG